MNDQELDIAMDKAFALVDESAAYSIELLAEYGARGRHVVAGYSSLFTYCMKKRKFSKHMAWRWSKAAQAIAADPGVAARLRDGRLSICVAAKLADRPELLARADGVSLEEAEQMIVAAQPRQEKRDVIPSREFRAEPVVAPREFRREPVAAPLEFRTEPVATAAPAVEFRTEPLAPPPKRPEIKPVSAQKSRLHCDVRKETLAKLQRARELQPGKDLDAILEAALDAYLDRMAPERRHERREKRAAAKAAPRAPRQRKTSDSNSKPLRKPLPRATKDASQVAAGCQCSYVAKSGTRCTERARLEDDHIQPLALGGNDDLKNLRPLCKQHHRLKTRESFPGWQPRWKDAATWRRE